MSSSDNVNTLGFSSMSKGFEANYKQLEELMSKFSSSHEDVNYDPFNLQQAWKDWLAAAAQNPEKLVEANMAMMQDTMKLYQQAALRMWNQSSDPVIKEEKGDRRFRHDDWNEQPVFEAIKQSYLLSSKWIRKVVSDVEGLDEATSQKMEFFTERLLDAMSPTNFAATNPAVLEKIKQTNGANLVHGLKNMLDDLEDGDGQLRIKMTDNTAFELGVNVAVTPGKVVFENRMFQLIQYSPTTETSFKRPLLITPPWINKFYILDLQPKNSMLRWLVEQGHTVFVMSWINPDESYKDTGFDAYVLEGVMEAVNQVEKATGESSINAIGYCIGGTLLATTLSYMKEKGDTRIHSATFFTTMIDFSEPGDLGIFVDEDQLQSLEEKMSETGFLEGRDMAGTFNLMRANDLIWSFYINNYLLGNDPRPFDLLYWNSDSTRMPCTMHSEYLRNMYLNNLLVEPGGITIDGVAIDINQIDTPACFISTVDDHIAPWKSTYAGAKRFNGSVKFILGGSGHIAGIINPPDANKYGFRTTSKLPTDCEAWAEKAEQHEGSWWPEWQRWIKQKAGKQVAARIPGDNQLDVIEDAPGSYVKTRVVD
ncbi:MAG: class I poly(R)-hydroxyalkanoic acid synthase [Pseudomonadota bacterium]